MMSAFRKWFSRVRGPVAVAPPEGPAAAPAVPNEPRASQTFEEDLAAAGLTVDAWSAGWQARPATYADAALPPVQELRARWSTEAAAVIAAAERTLDHEFDLLGSGWFTPADPDRPARGAYRPIDWYLDPVRNLRFPRGVPHKQWNLYAMRPGNADVKYPWELARCQHWVTLAQAWVLSGDDRFATEVALELDDFMEANPVGIGINWTCTMDVALRVVSWVVALDLLRNCQVLDAAFRARAAAALFDHGRFIRANLENTYEVTSNHFLSNVLGLWFLAALFHDLPQGREWDAFARQALETEIDVQVLPDGADFESSVPYHRLVAELFLGGARLAAVRGAPLSAHYLERTRDMIEYLASVTRPDGLMPQSGDADDGRLHVFGGISTRTPQDGRHLLGPAAMMFGHPAWLAQGGAEAEWEAAWWGLTPPAGAAPAHVPDVLRLFPDAGHAVVRERGRYLLITNSIVGTKGFGNHKHHDQLGFEYHVDGVPILVDPGSYVYTSDPSARNLFRGTGYHNTLMVDGTEQQEMNPEWLFRLFEQGRAEHLEFTVSDTRAVYRGRHHGYTRLPAPLVHERTFTLDRATGALSIADRVEGTGVHQLAWHWHFAPGAVPVLDAGHCRIDTSAGSFVLAFPPGLQARIADVWYSPSYGVRTRCAALDLTLDATLQGEAGWDFSVARAGART